MSIESSLKFLWECAITLEPKEYAHKLVKSYYINMCRRLLTVTQQRQWPKILSSSSQMCPKCGCLWQESDFTLKLLPQQIAHKAKFDKLLRKFEQNQKNPSERYCLTKKQKRRAKWLKKRLQNYLQINCQQCHNKTQIPMQKPLKSQTSIKIEKKSVKKQLHTCMSQKKTQSEDESTATDFTNKSNHHKKKNEIQKQLHQITTTNNNKLTKQHERQHQQFKQQQQQQQQRQQQQQQKQKQNKKKQIIMQKATVSKQKCTKALKKSSIVQLAALLKQKSTTGNSETVTKHLQALLN